MVKTLYVGNLPWALNETDLADFFSPYGDVHSARIITDRETGRSRGFGFIELETPDLSGAIEATSGKELSGRTIVVNEAKPREVR
ncbi:MAG: RNA recognition motif domain-containing protein [bacterium]